MGQVLDLDIIDAPLITAEEAISPTGGKNPLRLMISVPALLSILMGELDASADLLLIAD